MSYLDPKGRDFSNADVGLRPLTLAVFAADDAHAVNHSDPEAVLPDLLPRLVLADKLEELGYAVRAEFIRLCCSLAVIRQNLSIDPKKAYADENDPGYDTPELIRLLALISPPKDQVNRRWAELLGLDPDDAPDNLKIRFSLNSLKAGVLTDTWTWLSDFRARHVVRLLAHHPIRRVTFRPAYRGRSNHWYLWPVSQNESEVVVAAVEGLRHRGWWNTDGGMPDDLYAYLLDLAEAEQEAGRKVPRMVPHKMKGRPPVLRFQVYDAACNYFDQALDYANQRFVEALGVPTPGSRAEYLSAVHGQVVRFAQEAEASIYVYPHEVNLTDPPQEQADRLVARFREQRAAALKR